MYVAGWKEAGVSAALMQVCTYLSIYALTVTYGYNGMMNTAVSTWTSGAPML